MILQSAAAAPRPLFHNLTIYFSPLLPPSHTGTHLTDPKSLRFTHFHPEKIPSAQSRYIKEIGRVTSVLDSVLKSSPYLVGGKFSFADLAFVPWYSMVGFLDAKKELSLEKDYPHYAKWMGSLMERPSVKKVLADKQKASGH